MLFSVTKMSTTFLVIRWNQTLCQPSAVRIILTMYDLYCGFIWHLNFLESGVTSIIEYGNYYYIDHGEKCWVYNRNQLCIIKSFWKVKLKEAVKWRGCQSVCHMSAWVQTLVNGEHWASSTEFAIHNLLWHSIEKC